MSAPQASVFLRCFRRQIALFDCSGEIFKHGEVLRQIRRNAIGNLAELFCQGVDALSQGIIAPSQPDQENEEEGDDGDFNIHGD